jgi:hypothetical protein
MTILPVRYLSSASAASRMSKAPTFFDGGASVACLTAIASWIVV